MKVDDRAITEVKRRQRRRKWLPAVGLLEAMKVTLRTMLSRSVTVHYPEERIELPPRTRGVIALLEENCTVCMLCSKECPCWCIYIEGHKEKVEGKRKPVNALDRFAIDFGLCMYCGICVEVCPFDALHWSPAFEYTSFTYEGLVHERDVLASWEYAVLSPPELEPDADDAQHKQVAAAREKREQGVWGLIREAPKQDAYAAEFGTDWRPPSPQRAAITPPPMPERRPAVAAATAAPAAAGPAAAAPAASPPDAAPAAVAEPVAAPAAEPAPSAAAAPSGGGETFGLPRIDPMNLPDGIGPVERGRLKKLAVFQERGHQPPADLVENLKTLLDQMRGSG